MKDLSNIGISNSSSAAEIYNGMRQMSHTTFFEARRTLEAISRVQNHKALLKQVKEETFNEQERNRRTDPGSS